MQPVCGTRQHSYTRCVQTAAAHTAFSAGLSIMWQKITVFSHQQTVCNGPALVVTTLHFCAAACPGNPPNPDNGTFACGTSTVAGSNCTADCSAGYRGNPTATCTNTGQWGPVQGNCSLIGKWA